MARQESCPDPARLEGLLSGTLPEDEDHPLHEHLEACGYCQQTLEGLAAGGEMWSKASRRLARQQPDSPALDQVVAALEAEPPGAPADSDRAENLTLDFLSPADQPGLLGKVGDYDVVEVIGRGGMGIVLKAFDASLHRPVAIKVMAPQLATSDTARKRFLREAQAAAAVRDEHVIDIHAVAEANGLPYLVMEYISGCSLQQRLDAGQPLALEEILRIGTQVARGLAAAHQHGLVHRDVKPANILLENGVERVKITDFGLARAIDDASLTQSGLVAGTPQYMSPEQADGRPVDHRSDLFSLGSVLYAMCTGQDPFRAQGTMAVLRRIAEESPPAVGNVNPKLPAWLGDIIAKLHAKNPADRFQSAAEVAELLGQYVAHLHQPELVRLPVPRRSGPLRLRGALAAAVLLGALGLAGYLFGPMVYRFAINQGQLVIETEDADVEVKAKGPQVTIIDTKTQREVTLKAGKYELELVGGPPGLRLKTTDFTLERGGKEIVRVRLEPGVTTKAVYVFRHAEPPVLAVAFSADSRQVLSGGRDHAVRLWDVETGREIPCPAFGFREKGRDYSVYSLAISRDGRRALAGSREGKAWLLDLENRKVLHHCDHPRVGGGFGINSVAFSPDGWQALLGSYDGVVRVWDVEEWKELNRLQDRVGLWSVDYSPEGRRALTAGGKSGEMHLSWWDLKSLKELHRREGHEGGVWRAVFSPDGRLAASASHDKTLRLWDAETGKERRSLLHPDGVHSVCFSPDGRWLISGGYDGAVRLWDVKTGREVQRYVGHKGPIPSVAVSPNGRYVASGGVDNTARLWELPR